MVEIIQLKEHGIVPKKTKPLRETHGGRRRVLPSKTDQILFWNWGGTIGIGTVKILNGL